MIYIIRVYENNETFEYEYGNFPHAEEHFSWEKSAEVWLYENGKETLIKRK